MGHHHGNADVLIARAPLRISLAGGGTDLEAYYSKYGGAVVSATIDKYFYVFLSPSDSQHIQVSSSDYQTFYRQALGETPLSDGDLRLAKVIVNHFGIRTGLSVFLASQIPPGTGLGSSSTVSVGFIKAMAVLCGQRLSRAEVAELACRIEIDTLGMPIGKQDQYAAAFGGLNFIDFRTEAVTVQPFNLAPDALTALERRLMLFFTGRSRNSADILAEQKRSSERNRTVVIEALHQIKDSALRLREDLAAGNLTAVGERLHLSWMAKRQLARGISDPWIDQWYETARACGAAGGKIAGAGGGGFLLLYCEPEHQDRVTEALHRNGLSRMDFRFESGGAMVIMNNLVGKVPAGVLHPEAAAHAR
jgi:D-glycero-alpha-D-manno-heptose-7-phosphate kinase